MWPAGRCGGGCWGRGCPCGGRAGRCRDRRRLVLGQGRTHGAALVIRAGFVEVRRLLRTRTPCASCRRWSTSLRTGTRSSSTGALWLALKSGLTAAAHGSKRGPGQTPLTAPAGEESHPALPVPKRSGLRGWRSAAALPGGSESGCAGLRASCSPSDLRRNGANACGRATERCERLRNGRCSAWRLKHSTLLGSSWSLRSSLAQPDLQTWARRTAGQGGEFGLRRGVRTTGPGFSAWSGSVCRVIHSVL